MNLWYLLLLVCCCGQGGRTGCADKNSCIMPRSGGCMEKREERKQECSRQMQRDRDDCGCREKRREPESCMMAGGEKRYDCGMQERPCMDNVPEMSMPARYPVYPEKCGCRE